MILPGATLGVLGGGQLGRMFTIAARTMGYEVVVLDPDPHSPAGQVATEHIRAGYDDAEALAKLAGQCAAVTTEFENVPADSLRELARHRVVRPGADAVAILQERIREKTFLRDHGFPTSRFCVIRRAAELRAAFDAIGAPGLLKVSRFGYDGKGQARVATLDELTAAFRAMGEEACVLEEFLTLTAEVSVVLGRGADGETRAFPVGENRHVNGILDVTVVPARLPQSVCDGAVAMATRLAREVDYCGVMAVELFMLQDGRLVINEIAPRPHNSGHYTLDACLTNQFEQQVRILCGLPLGDPQLFSPVVMVNLLGDLWTRATPNWARLLAHPGVKLHLYGKREPRPGRKMGHFNCLADSTDAALTLAERLKTELAGKASGVASGATK